MTIREHDVRLKRHNDGLAFAHPLESSYARARRLLNANPGVGPQTLKRTFQFHEALRTKSDLETYLPPEINCRLVRQCPSCAKRLFHPVIFQLPALQQCPIHHQPFTTYCPTCKERWRRPLVERQPQCTHCGELSWADKGRTQLSARVYRRLGWLSNWLWKTVQERNTTPRSTLYDVRAITGWTGDAEGPRFQAPSLEHPYYLAFASANNQRRENIRLQALAAVTAEAPYLQRSTRLQVWAPPSVSMNYVRPNPRTHSASKISKLGQGLVSLALRRILRWHEVALSHPHALAWRDYRGIRPGEYSADGSLCIVCLAFSQWCQAVTLKYFNPMCVSTTGHSEVCRITRYDQFPVTPEGVYVNKETDVLYRPTAGFERWFYLRSTDYLFLEMIHLATWLRQRLIQGAPHYSPTFYHSSHRFMRPAFASQLLDVVPTSGGLRAAYLYSSPLDEIKLPREAHRLAQLCPLPPQPDAPLIWSALPGRMRPTAAELDRFIEVAAPSFHQSSHDHEWRAHTWAAMKDQPQPAIDTRACVSQLKAGC